MHTFDFSWEQRGPGDTGAASAWEGVVRADKWLPPYRGVRGTNVTVLSVASWVQTLRPAVIASIHLHCPFPPPSLPNQPYTVEMVIYA